MQDCWVPPAAIRQFLVALSLAAPAVACTGHQSSGEPVGEGSEPAADLSWFQCKAEAGAHHDVLLIDRDDASTAANARSTDEDADDSEPVRIRVSDADDGVAGECGTQAGAAGAAPVFACRANDQSITIVWPSNATTGTSTVGVAEPWLFGTRHYTAACTAKK